MVPSVQLVAFGDAAWGTLSGATGDRIFGDAGAGVLLHDALWDRAVTLRLDIPVYVANPRLAVSNTPGSDRFDFRWTFSFGDLP
jgi:hypothetical protein